MTTELAAYSIMTLGATLPFSQDGAAILEHGLFHNWSWYTLVPCLTQGLLSGVVCLMSCDDDAGLGGIFVGQVVKLAGGVQRGFSIIAGILLTGLIDVAVNNASFTLRASMHSLLAPASCVITADMKIALPLVVVGTYLHIKYPVCTTIVAALHDSHCSTQYVEKKAEKRE